MADSTPVRGRAFDATNSQFVGTFAIAIALIVVLLLFDTFLARIDRAEARSRAAQEFRQGRRLALAGEPGAAADRFRSAAAMDRTKSAYPVALARTLLAQGKTAGAERLLESILETDPTDGAANALMARALVSDGGIEEAKAHYHRAVYGHWRQGEGGSSTQARFELINLLARTNSRQELLAELLPIQDRLLVDLHLRNQIGRLYLVAGSPSRASEVFREVLKQRPDDAKAYAGLGEASLALGNYRLAEDQLTRATRLAPGDSAVTRQLDLTQSLLALDPTRRGLRLDARYQRSRRVLEATLSVLARCRLDVPAGEVLIAADSALKAPRSRTEGSINDTVEANILLAQRLWTARPTDCRQTSHQMSGRWCCCRIDSSGSQES